MSLMSIGKFAKEVAVTTTTLRTMAVTKELEPVHISKGGTRYYSTEQLSHFKKAVNDRITIGYCRVSTPSQKDDLNNQFGFEMLECLCKTNNVELVTTNNNCFRKQTVW